VEITDEQREQFLARVREGDNRQAAAEFCQEAFADPTLSATRFKFLCNRDAVFNRAYQEAVKEGKGSLVERLERCALEMAEGGHWPALKFLITTYGEQFAWARSNKVEVGGQVEITAVAGILARYLPSDMYDELISTVEQKMIEEGEVAA
jgi:hypothetical protein